MTIAGTISTSGDNTIINAVANVAIVLQTIVVQNESSTPTTILIKDGSNVLFRVQAEAKGDGLALDLTNAIRLEKNSPLIVNLSGANACGYSFQYTTV